MSDKTDQTYLIKAEAVVLGAGSKATYLYRGGIVPAGFATEEQIKHHLAIKAIEPIDLPVSEDVVEIPDGDVTDKWTVPQLKALAVRDEIDLTGKTAKPDVLAAVVDAQKAKAQQ